MPIRRSPNEARHTPPQPGRDRPEQVVAINRNAWSQSIGISGRNQSVRALESIEPRRFDDRMYVHGARPPSSLPRKTIFVADGETTVTVIAGWPRLPRVAKIQQRLPPTQIAWQVFASRIVLNSVP